MTKLRCLIVDDEPLAQDVLETYSAWVDELMLCGKCNNALEAFSFLKENEVDLLFLDIHMPRLSGIEFLKSLPKPPLVIFTTAFRDYALEGFELDVLDYLVKPISFERFLKAVNKAINLQDRMNGSHSQEAEALKQVREDFIFLKADKKMVKICLDNILYIESLKDYIRVKTDSRQVVSHQKISYMAEILPCSKFMRIHRSFIVPIHKVEAFSVGHVEINGKSIPIGRNYKSDVLETLNSLNMLNETS